MMGDHTVTVRATEDQHMAWTSAMSLLAQRNLGAFLRFAGDWAAEYYREENLQASLKDPVLARIVEKKNLRALLDAADAALHFIPKETNSPIRGPLPIKKDLREAVQGVRAWLAGNGGGVPVKLKMASFTVRATMAQSIAWKRAQEAEGFNSCGAWIAGAADSYLKLRARAGLPLPLAWRHGRFLVRLEDGAEPEVRGWIAPPFGFYHGSPEGPIPHGSSHYYTLTYLPGKRLVATFRYARQCRALAADLAAVYARSDGEGNIRAGPLIERYEKEAT
jgi:hypothetical protein